MTRAQQQETARRAGGDGDSWLATLEHELPMNLTQRAAHYQYREAELQVPRFVLPRTCSV